MVTPGMVVTTSVMPICRASRMSASLSGRDTMASRIMVASRAGCGAWCFGRAEPGILQLQLAFIDGALTLRRRQRQADRHVGHARRNEVGVAAQETGFERLPILRLFRQRPGVGGAVLIEQQAAR